MTNKGRFMIVVWTLAAFAGVFTCNSAKAGNSDGVHIGSPGGVQVFRIQDGATTCYVALRTQFSKGDSASISCVK